MPQHNSLWWLHWSQTLLLQNQVQIHLIDDGKLLLPFKYKIFRSRHQKYYIKKDFLKNFPKFTRKYLCQSLFFNKVAGNTFNFIKRILLNFLENIFYGTHFGDCFSTQSKAWNNKAFLPKFFPRPFLFSYFYIIKNIKGFSDRFW